MKILIACFVILTSLSVFAESNDGGVGEAKTNDCTDVSDSNLTKGSTNTIVVNGGTAVGTNQEGK